MGCVPNKNENLETFDCKQTLKEILDQKNDDLDNSQIRKLMTQSEIVQYQFQKQTKQNTILNSLPANKRSSSIISERSNSNKKYNQSSLIPILSKIQNNSRFPINERIKQNSLGNKIQQNSLVQNRLLFNPNHVIKNSPSLTPFIPSRSISPQPFVNVKYFNMRPPSLHKVQRII